MTEKQIITWISRELGPVIEKALTEAKVRNPALLYTKDWLVAMAYRETGLLIAKLLAQGGKTPAIYSLMRGDYGQRPGEIEKSFHGFGPWQIDIGSFPEFVKSGNWKDPYKTCVKAIEVLEGKRKYLQSKFPNLSGEALERAITAAYNCGEGNVKKALEAGEDVDSRTHQKNYSKEVWRFREIARPII
ncbi:hypothetical protein [Paraflavitalea speifideaquila]|uniref:hypothetical protein n=1 Tax=Paraflavitalea speifideaquila TaxID=3076558 RepID=UPI0028EDECE0|nr:hypothetical protein [Paraflavitalea speifideiaquila]